MERALIERNGGPVHVDGTGFTRIKNMERQLQILESQADTAHVCSPKMIPSKFVRKPKLKKLRPKLQNLPLLYKTFNTRRMLNVKQTEEQ